MTKAYTLMGYTVTNADEVRSVLVIAKLQNRQEVVKQALSLIDKYQKETDKNVRKR